MKRDYVIITAGGQGTRMGAEIPKQFLLIGGQPILMRTIERFREYSKALHIILVLPETQQKYWQELCRKYHFEVPCQLIGGGETRFHSIRQGLSLIPDDAEGVVGVHDGVRPFPSIEVIQRCFETARTTKAAVPVMPVVETLRNLLKGRNVPRRDYRLVQTPQVFDIQLLKRAGDLPYQEDFTDDASVVEALGEQVTLVEGNRENIKITTPFDLYLAEAILRKEEKNAQPTGTVYGE